MKYWQLIVRRPYTGEEIFDLRTHSKILAGDALSNDICLDSTEIPGKLLIVQSKFRNKVQLRLTDEIIPSLSGNFVKKKEWKTPLYSGSIFEITGDSEWKIGVTEFKIAQRQSMEMAPAPRENRSEAMKHWRQSVAASIGAHLLMFVIVFVSLVISKWSQKSVIHPESIQKVSILDVKKAFPNPATLDQPKPAVAETLDDTLREKPVAAEENQMAALSPKPMDAEPVVKPKGDPGIPKLSKLGASKSDRPAPRNIESMGLLAIQSTAKPRKTNLDVAALAVGSARSPETGKGVHGELGLSKGSSEFGIAADARGGEMVASLEGRGVEAYQGGLGEKVKQGSFRGASIKLVRREVEIRGGLDPAVIRQIIEERLSEVRYCYENALLKKTNLQGKISASWTILADGTVSDLKSESDEIETKILHPCIKDQIKNWKFPAPKGGGVVHVKYPFLFSPVGS